MKLTQRRLLLETFRAEGQLYSYQITGDLHIQQYNSRISDVRKEIGCTCINSRNRRLCTAKEHIISDKDNHFVYKTDTGVVETMPTTSKPVSGYERFRQMGLYLKNKQEERPVSHEQMYEQLDASELEAKKETAERWLRDNERHAAYPEALKRYQSICDELIRRTLVEA